MFTPTHPHTRGHRRTVGTELRIQSDNTQSAHTHRHTYMQIRAHAHCTHTRVGTDAQSCAYRQTAHSAAHTDRHTHPCRYMHTPTHTLTDTYYCTHHTQTTHNAVHAHTHKYRYMHTPTHIFSAPCRPGACALFRAHAKMHEFNEHHYHRSSLHEYNVLNSRLMTG